MFALDGEMINVNGKLLAGHTFLEDDFDQTSVCSCNCLGLTHTDNERYLLQLLLLTIIITIFIILDYY